MGDIDIIYKRNFLFSLKIMKVPNLISGKSKQLYYNTKCLRGLESVTKQHK